MKSRKFVDSVVVYAAGGNGGNGCVSFRHEKFVEFGGPDGGDGGKGGDVIFVGDREEDSLIRLYFTPHQRAKSGGHGKGKKMYGRKGDDLVVKVPCGTEVWNQETGEMVGDILAHGQQIVAAAGGKGGRGNVHWLTSTHQAPREHTDGGEGQTLTLRLELKLVADVGLIGFPNAGKSSILTAISDAHPRIASYPFTTLNPIIGTIVSDDYRRVTVADLPGLIEGASNGSGLGDQFLRHVERAPVLVFVLDMAGVDGRDPADDFRCLKSELKQYDKELIKRMHLVVANKMDLPEAAQNLKKFTRKTRIKPLPVSALMKEGLADLRSGILGLVHKPADR